MTLLKKKNLTAKSVKFAKFYDKEEKDLFESFNRGDWVLDPKSDEILKRHSEYARYSIEKNKSVTFRVNGWDIERLKAKAIAEGMPYQTLLSSLVHKYVSGKLSEK